MYNTSNQHMANASNNLNSERDKIDPFYVPMFITDCVIAEYKAGLDIVDREGEIYSKVLSTNISRKDPLEQGFLLFKNGNKYEGPITNGKMHGHGRLTFAENN